MKSCVLVNNLTNERTEFLVDGNAVTVNIYENDQIGETFFLDFDTAQSLKSHILKETSSKEIQ
jgi:hypothetical protein